MRVFCDTSVLVAAALEAHSQHASAKVVLERIVRGEDTGHISAHALAETFSVLSRTPTTPKLQPQDVLAILEKNILPHFALAVPAPEDYPQAIRPPGRQARPGSHLQLQRARAENPRARVGSLDLPAPASACVLMRSSWECQPSSCR
jgi:hypothetical protein